MKKKVIIFLLFSSFFFTFTKCDQSDFSSGVASCKRGSFKQAISFFQKSIEKKSNIAKALFNIGMCYIFTNELINAERTFKLLLKKYFDYTRAHLELARCLYQQKKYDEAETYFKVAIVQDYKSYDAHFGLAQILLKKNHLDGTMQHLDYLLSRKLTDTKKQEQLAQLLLDLGNIYFQQTKEQQAIDTFKKILSINKHFAYINHNIAFCLATQLNNHDEALFYYKKALEHNPKNPEIHFAYALSCLASGDFKTGWKEYQYRWQRKHKAPRAFGTTLDKYWQGEPLDGKIILIRCEQGLGDTLHFIRYAQLLNKQGAYVIAEVQNPLVPLLSLCPYLNKIVAMNDEIEYYDYQIPMLDLPLLFETTLKTIPTDIPYLYADESLEKKWHKKLSNDKTFKVGICWHGEASNGKHKFMPLKKFAPLLNMDGVTFYSLQKFTGLNQLEQLPKKYCIKAFDEKFDVKHGSFMDTAAVIKNLDLVITVDTSVAHLSGALGIETWIILPFCSEWRWLTEKTDSPWYPTIRLFRAIKKNKWSNVQKNLITQLQKKMNKFTL
ncbi:tetratricopeptide repeat protein [bacterium]|nr:tetratricopeptide repeat protein [bacterium]